MLVNPEATLLATNKTRMVPPVCGGRGVLKNPYHGGISVTLKWRRKKLLKQEMKKTWDSH
jgi:hypothetical protein